MTWIIKRAECEFAYLGMKTGIGPWRPHRGDAVRFTDLEEAREVARHHAKKNTGVRVFRLVKVAPQRQSETTKGEER